MEIKDQDFKNKILLGKIPLWRKFIYYCISYTLLPLLIIFFVFRFTFKELGLFYRNWYRDRKDLRRLRKLIELD